MIDSYARGLTVVAAIGAGVAAGVYLAFSTFIMPGLRRTAPSQAISAFNGINKAAPASPLLMLVLFGTGVACVLLLISGFLHRGEPAATWQLVGAALYLISVIVTIAYHIPHNDQFMKVDPSAAGAGDTWSHFYSGWMAWNHVRTLTSVGGTVSLVLALRAGP
jgi:uncharacterized membrane protein